MTLVLSTFHILNSDCKYFLLIFLINLIMYFETYYTSAFWSIYIAVYVSVPADLLHISTRWQFLN